MAKEREGASVWGARRLRSNATPLGLAIVLVLLFAALPAPASATTPGTPGVPQPGTPVFFENFENVAGAAAVGVQNYTGAAGADNESYIEDPAYRSTANNCNGWILDLTTPGPGTDSCINGGIWAHSQDLVDALGQYSGEPASVAGTNHAIVEFTGNNASNMGIELQTSPNAIPAVPGDFYDAQADYAAVDYNGGAAGCDINDPEVDFYLLSGATKYQVGSGLDPCTASGNTAITVNGEAIRAADLVSQAMQWAGGSTMGVEQYNAQATGTGNDGATDNIQIVNVTPQLDKSFSPSTLTTGQTSTLTFTITNTSELGAKDGWSFTDSLPTGLVVANPAAAATTCGSATVTAAAGGSSIAVTGNLNAGQAFCTATVNVTASTPGAYTNGGGNVTGTGVNPPGSASVTFQDADLQISKSASPATAVPGTEETYTLVAKNNGPATAVATTVSDPLPSGLSFVSASTGCSFASGTVTCAAGDMTPGASEAFTVVAKVPTSQTARITNTVTTHSPTPDPNPANNTATVTTPVGANADLEILKTASVRSIKAGGQVAYTLVVNDNGPSDATGVVVSDALPAGLSLVSATPSQGSCSGTTCQLGTIVDGGSAQILLTADVAVSAGGAVTNVATVTGNNPDPDPGNNTGGSTITVIQPPPPPAPAQPRSDLQVVKRVDHSAAYPGQTLTYTLVVSNNGPDAATSTRITDTASLKLKVVKVKPSQGSCHAARAIACALGTIATGKTVTITVTGRVLQVGTEKNTASATSASEDSNPADNLASATTTLRPVLRLVKSASPKTLHAGGTITYHLKVSNPTSIAIRRVQVCDRLPRALSYQSSSPKAKRSTGTDCWTIKSLGAGRSRTLTVIARGVKGTPGRVINHATATANGVRTAHATATVHVTPLALKLTKTASRRVATTGQNVTYTLKLSDLSTGAATRVKVCDRLPRGLLYLGSDPRARLGTRGYCWTIKRLGARTSRTLQIVVNVAPGVSGKVTNHASATVTGARTARARATIHVKALQPVGCPSVVASAASRHAGNPIARIAC